jgi:hypothetical protein
VRGAGVRAAWCGVCSAVLLVEEVATLVAEHKFEARLAREKSEVLLRQLERRGIVDATREYVLSISDLPLQRDLIDVWLDRVATANSMEERCFFNITASEVDRI